MPRAKHIKTLEQTSVGANGFRLQHLIDKNLFEVIHSHHDGHKDKTDRTFFTNEHDAIKYYNTLMNETIETIPNREYYPLITKII